MDLNLIEDKFWMITDLPRDSQEELNKAFYLIMKYLDTDCVYNNNSPTHVGTPSALKVHGSSWDGSVRHNKDHEIWVWRDSDKNNTLLEEPEVMAFYDFIIMYGTEEEKATFIPKIPIKRLYMDNPR